MLRHTYNERNNQAVCDRFPDNIRYLAARNFHDYITGFGGRRPRFTVEFMKTGGLFFMAYTTTGGMLVRGELTTDNKTVNVRGRYRWATYAETDNLLSEEQYLCLGFLVRVDRLVRTLKKLEASK